MPKVIFAGWCEVARCRAEFWPEEDERLKRYFKKTSWSPVEV